MARTARVPVRGAPVLSVSALRGWRQFIRELLLGRRNGLPAPVVLFYARACRVAVREADDFTLVAMTRSDDLATVLRLARGKKRVVEIGTGGGTTTIALALDDRDRFVWSYDVKPPRPTRDRYLGLAPRDVARRISFLQESGAEPSAPPSSVDFVFIDGSHQREDTVATFRAWRRQLAPGGTIAFHDFGRNWPGVSEAIDDLGLKGEVEGLVFSWRESSDQDREGLAPPR